MGDTELVKVDVLFAFPATGQKEVFLSGSFLNWTDPLPMLKDVTREPHYFCLTLSLPVGIHQFKYIVDGEWKVSPESAIMQDLNGNINNCISVRRAPVAQHAIPKEWKQRIAANSPTQTPTVQRNQLMLPGVSQIKKSQSYKKQPSGGVYNTDIHNSTKHKLLLVTVGLPARGKSFISQKVSRYLDWLGFSSKVFDTCTYRKQTLGKFYNHDWYDPDNYEASKLRFKITSVALDDIFAWFKNEDGTVAVLDGTNCSKKRREYILKLVKSQKPELCIRPIFLEIIVNDPDVVMANILANVDSPDYIGMDKETVIDDLTQKIRNYRKIYEPVADEYRYIRVFDAGKQIVTNRVTGFLPGKVSFYLSNFRTQSKDIYFVRHGQSEYNVLKLIGGDSGLTPRGFEFAAKLRDWAQINIDSPSESLSVWSSTMKRAIQTAEDVPCSQYIRWKVLEEIEAGICDSMTYEQIEETFPEEFEARSMDKLRYRYPRGESYEDLIRRVEPVIIELERRSTPVLIVAHQAILRCMYAYFKDFSRYEVPHIKFPSECVVKVTPQAFGAKEERFYLTSNSHQ